MKKMREASCHNLCFMPGCCSSWQLRPSSCCRRGGAANVFLLTAACCGSRREHAAHYPGKAIFLQKRHRDAGAGGGRDRFPLLGTRPPPVYGNMWPTGWCSGRGRDKTRGQPPGSGGSVDGGEADILAVYQKNLPAMTALGRLFATAGMVAVLALFFCGVWICLHPDNGENAENGTGGAAHRRIRRWCKRSCGDWKKKGLDTG